MVFYLSVKIDDSLMASMVEYAESHGYGKGTSFNKAELIRNAIRNLVLKEEV